jgi:hypothetical protein
MHFHFHWHRVTVAVSWQVLRSVELGARMSMPTARIACLVKLVPIMDDPLLELTSSKISGQRGGSGLGELQLALTIRKVGHGVALSSCPGSPPRSLPRPAPQVASKTMEGPLPPLALLTLCRVLWTIAGAPCGKPGAGLWW